MGYILGLYALYMFKKLKLDIKYQKEIEEWLKYKREELYKSNIDKKISTNMDKVFSDSVDRAMKKAFPHIIHPIEYP